jgi:hypothetical protein
VQLTNADRRALLENFQTLSAEWTGDDRELIGWVTEWTASLVPTFGFELSLSRDVLILCDTLRKANDCETTQLARGGLAYLFRNNHIEPPKFGSLGLLADVFVTGYAAYSIREKTDGTAYYSPPRLQQDEQAKAEAMFLEFLELPADNDNVLPELAGVALKKLGHLLESSVFRRLDMNVRFLSKVLCEKGRSSEHRQIARAALHYVAHENDAIPDSLGLIGFIDDYFVADLAVELIDESRSPWMNLIDAVVGAWPFLNMVAFGDGQRGIAASEFMLVNTALTCPAVRGSDSKTLTHLILPRTGPLPLLLGFFASLGEVATARTKQGSTVSFEVGQKILMDGKGGAFTFEGCKLVDGKMSFGVGKTRKERGETLRSIQWMPLEQLGRLVPADSKRSARGRLKVHDLRAEPLGVLDFLFLASEPFTLPLNLPQIVVVTPVGLAKQFADTVSILGHTLSEIVPMGNLTTSGEICHWSSRFGTTKPMLLVIPDMDRACEYVEEEEERVSLTVVDASGQNAGRIASLSRLQGMGARVLVAVPEPDADEVLDDDQDAMVWEWSSSDFESMYVEPDEITIDANPVRAYEREIVRAVSADVEIVSVPTPEVNDAFLAISILKRLVEARNEDVPMGLEEALGQSFSVLTRLMRCPFSLGSHSRLHAHVSAKIAAIPLYCSSGVFLTNEERSALADVCVRLRTMLNVFQDRNPKEEVLSRLRATHPELAVISGDVELLDRTDDLNVLGVDSVFSRADVGYKSAYAIAGWFGRGTMTRLLRPPFATPLYLLLYSPEIAWRKSFIRHVRESTAARRVRTARSRLFPGVGKWPTPPGGTDLNMPDQELQVSETPDAIEMYLQSKRRSRATSLVSPSPGEESVAARLITFDGGHAFLTDDYQAKVASHLLTNEAAGEGAELVIVPARRLRRGDMLLFLRGSSRDVIRQVADGLLPSDEREQAGLWRRALLNYQRLQNCDVEITWRRLREHGCPLSLAAIENWFDDENIISPANVGREVGAILELTQDAELQKGLAACRGSISRVRGAHLKASHQLAKRVIEQAVAGLKSAGSKNRAIDLGEGIVLARVTEIDDNPIQVRASAANILVEDESWPA